MATQQCPLCSAEVSPNPRYPKYDCEACAAKASSANGRPLKFSNVDMSGGCVGEYADTGDVYRGNVCYIGGVRCLASEARFGGIVIEVARSWWSRIFRGR